MATLTLSSGDLNKVRSSWSDIMAKNHYKNDNIVNDLFTNLLIANPNLKAVFKDRAVRGEQQELFGELLNFTMMYLHNTRVLDECMNEFIKENPSLIRVGVSYLEPMGAVLITTLRNSLGENFHAGLETLWIKVYIYIANCILQNDQLDAELMAELMTEQVEQQKEEEVEEAPLRVPAARNFREKPLPALVPTGNSDTIKVDLGSNEKYRGFRRSITESPEEPVSVRVPAMFMSHVPKSSGPVRSSSTSPTLSEALDAVFDPRPLRRKPSMEEPMLTPRSSRRNSSAQLVEMAVEDNVEKDVASFDPRRKSHRRTGSDMSEGMESPERRVLGSSCESPVSDVSDEFRLEDEMDFTQTCKPRVFDYNSFGIKGLAPIAESENDDYDNASSNYEATEEKGLEDDSSRASSLSLHNLDYKSSISSGLSPIVDSNHKATVSDVSFMPDLSHNLYTNRTFLNSTPSFSLRSSGHRASLGFMRSSFILKKEMQEVGYSLPENVLMHTVEPVPRKLLMSRSVALLPLELYGKKSLFSAENFVTELPGKSKAVPQKAAKKEVSTPKKEKTSFRKKLGSFFASSPSPPPAKAPISTRKISAPISVSTPPVAAAPKAATKSKTSSPSMHSTQSPMRENYPTSSRVSSSDFRRQPRVAPAGYASSVYLKPQTVTDNASIHSSSSGTSGFSLFTRNKKKAARYPEGVEEMKKVNKYQVNKVPYKTIYVKDFIRA